jgi:glycine hydroxymethyltransferase
MVKTLLESGVSIVSGGTKCHMFTIDLSNEKLSGKQYADLLELKGITVNKNGVPGEKRSFIETSGVRIGVAAETTKGHKEDWFIVLAHIMVKFLKNNL